MGGGHTAHFTHVCRIPPAVSEDVAMAQSESSSLSSVWDSVVTWMKQAVDFVTVEADPTTPRPQGKASYIATYCNTSLL